MSRDQADYSKQEVLIQLNGVSKRYGSKLAVDSVDLSIHAGELFACLGPNGAGKTTTIKMITGLLKPTTGSIKVVGRDVATDPIESLRVISYVPDQPFLYEKLTGREILRFIRDIHGIDGARADEDERRLIDLFELHEFVDRLTESYSHGMRQRTAFAAAMLTRPRVLIVDEPMVGLDPKSMRIVKNVLRETADGGAAVFMSTHTLSVAEEVADRVGIFHRGKLIRIGSIGAIQGESKSNRTLEEFFLDVTSGATDD